MPNNFTSRQDLVALIVDEVSAVGSYADKKHTMVADGYVIWVRDNQTGINVAYSSTKADFEQSLEEFASDYFAP